MFPRMLRLYRLLRCTQITIRGERLTAHTADQRTATHPTMQTDTQATRVVELCVWRVCMLMLLLLLMHLLLLLLMMMVVLRVEVEVGEGGREVIAVHQITRIELIEIAGAGMVFRQVSRRLLLAVVQ